MEHQYLLGTDIGSSSTKTVITDEHGNVLASAVESYDILCPQTRGPSSGRMYGRMPCAIPYVPL